MRIQDKHEALGVAPFIAQTKGRHEWGEPELAACRRVFESGVWGWESGEFAALESEFGQAHGLLGSHSVISVTNGTVAITLVLEALDIGVGDEVISEAMTWSGTNDPILQVNATPVLLDVDPETGTLDPDKVEAYLEECVAKGKTLPKAIIVVHKFHCSADMDRFVEISRGYGVFLIEDCAHAHGGAWRGRALGTFGVAGTFSFEDSKTAAVGEGGAIITGVPMIDRRLRSLRSCGRKVDASDIDLSAAADELTTYWRRKVDFLRLPLWPIESGNYRMSAIVAAVLRAQLERFPALHEERAAGLIALERELRRVDGVRLLPLQEQLTSRFAYRAAGEYEPERYAGMDPELFCEVYTYLLGGHLVLRPYDPAGGPSGYRSPVYNPQTKRRHRLDDDYWRGIDPDRWPSPVSHEMFGRGFTVLHPLLRESGGAVAAVRAAEWMRDNAERIVDAAR